MVGAYAGSPADADAAEIIGRIRAARPDVLFVAYGAPKQDLWIAKHRAAPGVPVMMGVGGSLDFIVGVQKRAPGVGAAGEPGMALPADHAALALAPAVGPAEFVWAVLTRKITAGGRADTAGR